MLEAVGAILGGLFLGSLSSMPHALSTFLKAFSLSLHRVFLSEHRNKNPLAPMVCSGSLLGKGSRWLVGALGLGVPSAVCATSWGLWALGPLV